MELSKMFVTFFHLRKVLRCCTMIFFIASLLGKAQLWTMLSDRMLYMTDHTHLISLEHKKLIWSIDKYWVRIFLNNLIFWLCPVLMVLRKKSLREVANSRIVGCRLKYTISLTCKVVGQDDHETNENLDTSKINVFNSAHWSHSFHQMSITIPCCGILNL